MTGQRPAPRVRVIAGNAVADNGDGTVTITTDTGPIIAANTPAALIVDDQAWAIGGAAGGSGGSVPTTDTTTGTTTATMPAPAGGWVSGDMVIVVWNRISGSNVTAVVPGGWTQFGGAGTPGYVMGMIRGYLFTGSPGSSADFFFTGAPTDSITIVRIRTGATGTYTYGADGSWQSGTPSINWPIGNTAATGFTLFLYCHPGPTTLTGYPAGTRTYPIGASGQAGWAYMTGGTHTISMTKNPNGLIVELSWRGRALS